MLICINPTLHGILYILEMAIFLTQLKFSSQGIYHVSILLTSDLSMYIETPYQFVPARRRWYLTHRKKGGGGSVKGKHILLTSDLDIYIETSIHF